MYFWDLFVRRNCATFLEGNSLGMGAARDVLDTAFNVALLDVSALDDASVQLCLLVSDPGSTFSSTAEAEYAARIAVVPFGDRGEPLLGYLRLMTTDLTNLSPATPPSVSPALSTRSTALLYAWRRQYLPWYADYQTRLRMIEYGVAGWFADIDFDTCFRSFGPVERMEASGDFVRYLYREGQQLTSLSSVARTWPTPPPGWAAGLEAAERTFLDCVLDLEVEQFRQIIYMSFYGRLNVEQMQYVMSSVNPAWTLSVTEDAARRAWLAVIRCMAARGGQE